MKRKLAALVLYKTDKSVALSVQVFVIAWETVMKSAALRSWSTRIRSNTFYDQPSKIFKVQEHARKDNPQLASTIDISNRFGRCTPIPMSQPQCTLAEMIWTLPLNALQRLRWNNRNTSLLMSSCSITWRTLWQNGYPLGPYFVLSLSWPPCWIVPTRFCCIFFTWPCRQYPESLSLKRKM